jgi:hypothetical protein
MGRKRETKRKRATGPGKGRRVRPGSGHHPLDLEWGALGWLTIKQAAVLAGVTDRVLRKQLESGRPDLVDGIDWKRVGEKQVGVIYVRREAAAALRAARLP